MSSAAEAVRVVPVTEAPWVDVRAVFGALSSFEAAGFPVTARLVEGQAVVRLEL
jgi:hypothetical protein